jgi:hypothetical protein
LCDVDNENNHILGEELVFLLSCNNLQVIIMHFQVLSDEIKITWSLFVLIFNIGHMVFEDVLKELYLLNPRVREKEKRK